MLIFHVLTFTFTKAKKFNFIRKSWIKDRPIAGVAAGVVPDVEALPHHDEHAGHEGRQQGGGGGEPEVVRGAKPV